MDEDYQKHYSPDGEYIEYLMEHPELNQNPPLNKSLKDMKTPVSKGKPIRVQRKRTKGWKMPNNTLYVGRPSKWGNPYKVGQKGFMFTLIRDNVQACLEFERYILSHSRSLKYEAKIELKGKNLSCWCPLNDKNGNRVPCHADILLQIANS